MSLPGIDSRIYSKMPRSAKAGVAILAGASILTISYYVFGGNRAAMVIIGGGVFAVITLLWFYKKALKWHRKARSNPLTQGLVGNAAATPQGISEPARRARLDDLRRNFDQGVEKFRAAGKNLYSVPWYVLVGEPGSGKTEAIRHCNVGFPPGLQDQLQGAGGTLNMNWWFTNQAIILDTAGRLMFEEVVPGSTNEWNEFLKLLKANRPNCPINGMILVIPVDTLIKDSADSIEKKASKIAQQFDQIQRILGVRFPVFIIITKCDLLNGFREFFDDLNDPQLQHQIMGWSNPAPLDEKFDPKAVTDHMENVKKRLTDRRQHLLLDPVNTEDAQGRRVDQVDALYALPDSLTKIAPRLRRYLEMVFVAGEWSPKPLFLRGIYFTSSMTEGSALDAELAEVLGVPVDSLPEGRVWRRDRAYFLRDLFIEKVFREKGLVTRADNADKQQRRRRAIVMTFGFSAVIVLLLLTWLGSRSLENRIGGQRDFWEAAAKNDPQFMQIIAKNNVYNSAPFKGGDGKDTTVAQFFGSNLSLVQKSIDIPFIFRPMAYISGDVDKNRAQAYRALYEATILKPLYASARTRLDATTAADWNENATQTLAQLMKLEYADAVHKAPETEVVHPQVDLDPMFHFVLSSDDYAKAKPDLTRPNDNLQLAADWIYSGDRSKKWPPPPLDADAAESRKVISESITKLIDYWKIQATEKGPRMGGILKMKQALADFRDAENKLLVMRTRTVNKLEPYNGYVSEWQAAYSQLITARKRASDEWTSLTSKGVPDSATLRTLYTDALEQVANDAQKDLGGLVKLTPAGDDAKLAMASASGQSLAGDRQKLTEAQGLVRDWQTGADAKAALADIATLDDAYLATIKGIDGNQHHRFEVQAQLYELADRLLPKPGAAATTLPANAVLGDALLQVDNDLTKANDTISTAIFQAQEKDRLAQAGDLARFTIDLGGRYRRYVLISAAAEAMPADAEKWPDYIAARSPAYPPEHLSRPEVPVTVADKTFQAKFSPDAVGGATDAMTAIEKLTGDPAAKVLDIGLVTARMASVRKALDAYLSVYKHYWLKDAFDEIHFAPKNWTEFAAALNNVREPVIRDSLGLYSKQALYALRRIGDSASVATLEAEGRMGAETGFQGESAAVLGHWKDLGNDPRQARGTILVMDPKKFLEQYTVGNAKSSGGYVAGYWSSLSLEALRVLAADSQKDILDGIKELAKYQRFPLAPPGDKKDDLTAQELILARAAVEKIKGATGAGLAVGQSIGQGGLTSDNAVDDQLKRLRGDNLLKSMQTYLGQIEKFFAVLPMNNKPTSVTLSVIKDKLKEADAVSMKYNSMVLSQGGKTLREIYVQNTEKESADVEYPGGDIQFQFREFPNGPFVTSEAPIAGPWAPFRLIKSDKVKVLSRDGTKWTLEYSVKDSNNKTWLIWFLLDFKAEVPDLKDWPVPPTQAPAP